MEDRKQEASPGEMLSPLNPQELEAGDYNPEPELPEGDALWTLEYDITVEENVKAFAAYQKRYVFRKNLIYTAAFAIITALYAVQLVQNPDYTMGYALLGVCLAVIFFIWYNPYKARRKLAEGLSHLREDRYICQIHEDCMVIHTLLPDEDGEGGEINLIPPSIIRYTQADMELLEIPEALLVCIRKQMFYVLPKRAMRGDEIDAIREFFAHKFNL